jgi:hypothetical protein
MTNPKKLILCSLFLTLSSYNVVASTEDLSVLAIAGSSLESHSFFSKTELEIWSDRAVNGPFLNAGDAFISSPGSYNRIKTNAGTLGLYENEVVVTGSCVSVDSDDGKTMVGSTGFGKIDVAREAAFVDLLESTSNNTSTVKSLLLQQAQEPCMDFSNRTLYPYNNKDGVWLYAEWIHRVLLTYDYLGRDVFTTEEQDVMDNWFKSAADWFDYIITDRSMDGLYVSRTGLPENYVINFDHWANTGVGEQRYKNSGVFHPPGSWIDSKKLGIANFITHVGVMYDEKEWKETGAQLVREYVSFYFDENGYFAELNRSTGNIPTFGLAYGANALANVAGISYILNFDGYTNLFEYESNATIDPATGDIIMGSVTKSLEWVLLSMRKNFMLADAPAIYPLNNTSENSTQVIHLCLNNGGYYSTQVAGRFYSGAAIINNYYKNSVIEEIYASEYGNMCGVIANDQISDEAHGVAPSFLFQYAGADTIKEESIGLHSFTSQTELRTWSERAVNGPFLTTGDAFISSPGSYNRIKSYADLLSLHESEVVLTGSCVALDSDIPSTMIPNNGFGRMNTVRDAAFVDFVEGSSSSTKTIKSLLLQQAQEPCMDFSNRMLYPYNNKDGVWLYAEWMHRVLLTYDYLGRDAFTTENQDIMDNWFKSAADWFGYILTDRSMDGLYASRTGLPENYVINFDHASNTGVGEQRYKNSTVFHPPSTWINNRKFGMANFVTHVGVMYDNKEWKEIGAQLVREYVSFHFDENGYFAELHRSTGITSESSPFTGLSYGANTFLNAAEIAHVLNFDGYTNLFEYESYTTIDPDTGDIAIGPVNKSLEWVALSFRKNFMLADASAIYPLKNTVEDMAQIIHICLNEDDSARQVAGRFYSGTAIVNNYYKNPLIEAMYASEYGNLCGVVANDEIRHGPNGVAPSFLFQYADVE